MYDTGKDLLDALKATPDTLRFLLRDVDREKAASARGGDEGWSVVEVVCHLRDAEEQASERARLMLSENDPVVAGYDQDEWARERNYAGDDLQSALEAFVRFRQEHIAQLEGISPQDWQRTGRHEEQGNITVEAHTLHLAAHDAQHMAQLARQLQI